MTYEMVLQCMEIVRQFYGVVKAQAGSRLLFVDNVLLDMDVVSGEYCDVQQDLGEKLCDAHILIHIGAEGMSWLLFGKFKDGAIAVAKYYRYCCEKGEWEYFWWKRKPGEWGRDANVETDIVSVFSEMMFLCNGYVYSMDETNYSAYKTAVHRLDLLLGGG